MKTHQMSSYPEYIVWKGMIQRCYYTKHARYKDYGGRGIKVCPDWRNSFENFYRNMGPRPEGFRLERLDNDKDYEPGNCVWTDNKTQARNKRDSTLITFNEDTLTLAEWIEVSNLPITTVIMRRRRGWTDAQALGFDPPPDRRRTLRPLDRPTPVNRSEQRHRESTIFIEYNNIVHTLPELAEAVGINYDVMLRRYNLGWSVERMTTRGVAPYQGKPIQHEGNTTNITTLAKEAGLSKQAVFNRIKLGWTLEEALTPTDGRAVGVSRRQRHTVTHNGVVKTLGQACEEIGVKYHTVLMRKRRNNLTYQQAFDLFNK